MRKCSCERPVPVPQEDRTYSCAKCGYEIKVKKKAAANA